MLALDAPSPAVKEMERNIGLNEDVIRQLTVRERQRVNRVDELDPLGGQRLDVLEVVSRRRVERG